MLKIDSIHALEKKRRYLKKGSMHLCYWGNSNFTGKPCIHVLVKSQTGQCRVFDIGMHGEPCKMAYKFAKSKLAWL